MLTRRRVLIGLPLLLLFAAICWTGWLAWGIQADLRAAERSADRLQRAAAAGDDAGVSAAAEQLRRHSAAAAAGTAGPTWRAVSHLPFVGDDARGVRALSRSLELISDQGMTPLLESMEAIRNVSRDGRIDIERVRSLREPVTAGHRTMAAAAEELTAVDSSGFTGLLRGRYDDFTDTVLGLERGLGAAAEVSAVLPSMVGAEGERRYLVAFLNNAEIRSSGGMPGAFAQVHARDGKLTMVSQGTPSDLGPERPSPVLPLSPQERELFGVQLGTYFQDANFIPHMPRTAELMAARYTETYDVSLDGVITIDTVAMSYLLRGTGPIKTADGVTLNADNAVTELLNNTYLNIADAAVQNERFEDVAARTFEAVTGQVRDQFELAKAFGRAASEGRLLVHSFHPAEQERLAGTRVAGELTTAAADVPEVDISLDDATASKMSYYLRYTTDVRADSCRDGVQTLAGTMRIGSDISAELAAGLPVSIVNDGRYGTEPGNQLVALRIYGPVGGSIDRVRMDGEVIEFDTVDLDGRPVANLVTFLAPTDDVDVTWTMTSGPGQTGDVDLGVTPSVVPGDKNATSPSACHR